MPNNWLELVTDPLLTPTDPGRRLFWLFLLSALLMASIAVSLRQRRIDLRYQLSHLFSASYWFHRSNFTDAGLLFFNNGLKTLLLIPLFGSHLVGAIWVGTLLQRHLGDAPELPGSVLLVGILYTIVYFVIEDLSRFFLHRCLHRYPLLWRFHRTHHSATNLSPLTVHRVHPVEMALYYLRGFLVFSIVSGLFIYLFKGRVNGIDILGVDCLGFLFNLLGANLRHTPVWLSFGPLERLFISPAQHQLHHSCATEHLNKNFGTCFALWDKLTGSWLPSGPHQKLAFGLARAELQPTFSQPPAIEKPRHCAAGEI